ncbi:MAG: DNA translocase FtsK 4TM domain-containing protein, partial [Betaproteobacteria bacterium]
MTYSLNTLNNSKDNPPSASGWQRFVQEIALSLGFVFLLFWLVAMLSHTAQDPAWTTSGSSAVPHNWGGRIGAAISDLGFFIAGYSIVWCYLASLVSWLNALAARMRSEDSPVVEAHMWRLSRWAFWSGLVLLMLSSTGLEYTRLYRFDAHIAGHHAGGILGYLVGGAAAKWLGFNGSALVFIVFMLVGLSWTFGFSWVQLAEKIGAGIDQAIAGWRERREMAEDLALGQAAAREREEDVQTDRVDSEELPPRPVRILVDPEPLAPPKSERMARERQKPLFNDMPDSRLPQVDLLDDSQTRQDPVDAETIEFTSRLIEKKLRDFGVEVKVLAAAPGPVVTRYEIEPATGVKGSQIVNLAKDLARSLSMVSIRVVETIPGKNFMALELPNAKRQSIRLSEILGSEVYNEAKSLLTMGLGKDIGGHPVVADLAKMPHVLVAGTTGSGKSVGINAMILSLLYKAEARDVRLLMIDPKMLEMSVYEGIPHLLAPVVTDMRQAAHGLNWCVGEMERRYKLMSKLGVRNLAGYNH